MAPKTKGPPDVPSRQKKRSHQELRLLASPIGRMACRRICRDFPHGLVQLRPGPALLPDIQSEVDWLELQAEIKAKIGPSVRGVIDVVRLHEGTHVVITRLLDGECSGWFVRLDVIREMGLDRLAAQLIRQLRDAQRGREQ